MAAEVITRAVVALPEDANVAEAGRLLLERRITSILVVRGRRVVGIVARRDLLEVLARRDEDIAWALEALLASELGPPSPRRATVRDGVGELTRPADPTSRRLVRLLAREVPGVVEVRFDEKVMAMTVSGASSWPPGYGYSQHRIEELRATIDGCVVCP